MSPSRLHWPARRSLFRKRPRAGLGVSLVLSVFALVVVVATSWQA